MVLTLAEEFIAKKAGFTYPKGLKIVVRPLKGRESIGCQIVAEDGSVGSCKIKYTTLASICEELQNPDMRQLSEWSYDSVCESVLGHMVEPDGYDGYGFPSWLIVLGIV